jgi:hypothetical protein
LQKDYAEIAHRLSENFNKESIDANILLLLLIGKLTKEWNFVDSKNLPIEASIKNIVLLDKAYLDLIMEDFMVQMDEVF